MSEIIVSDSTVSVIPVLPSVEPALMMTPLRPDMTIFEVRSDRPDSPRQRVLALKAETLRMLDDLWKDPALCIQYDTMSAVNAFALLEDVVETNPALATSHFKSLQDMIDRHGGPDRVQNEDLFLTNLCTWTANLQGQFSREPTRRTFDLPVRAREETTAADGVNVLRQALQPSHSDLALSCTRSHLVMSSAGQTEQLFRLLDALHGVALTLEAPVPQQSDGVRTMIHRSLASLEDSILKLDSLSETMSGDIDPRDRANYRDTYQLIKLSVLVLVCRVKQAATLRRSAVGHGHGLDHAVQGLFMHIFDPYLAVNSYEALCWAIAVGGPFLDQDSYLRERAAMFLHKLCQRFHINDLTSLQRFLRRIYYLPIIQDFSLSVFFQESRIAEEH